ncbi:undecaprenyl diphosphate synthase family protein [Candidatus Acetothermia bacterium]|nr:undecaprenyl diphosphate synthase family protein [Candidatus Acetothermia bacterium]MBI3644081.1 undecaprenyl diphosphate synthase family protein [Candidatus Acetothermia bacterium]
MSVLTRVDELSTKIEALRKLDLPDHIVLFAGSPDVQGVTEQLIESLFGDLSIQYVTLIFDKEVSGAHFLRDASLLLEKYEVRVHLLGSSKETSPEAQALFAKMTTATRNFSQHHLSIAVNYNSRQEILQAAKHYVADKAHGRLNGESLGEATFREYLLTREIPDPDLIINTDKKRCISNALLWQLAYTEFWTSDKTWADLTSSDLIEAIVAYQFRQRRFGGLTQPT